MDRAIFFVDGNNWYHSLKSTGMRDLGRLRYKRICEKLVGPRTWLALRYYIPDVGIMGSPDLLQEQRDFLSQLERQDPRISVHFGRLEPRAPENEAAKELLRYLAELKERIAIRVYKDLIALGRRHEHARIFVEKAVDVQIAVDMLNLAVNDEYDTAYLLSADGDYTPAVEAIRARGKKVFAVSPAHGAKLAAAANAYIHLEPPWFDDCFRP